MAMHPTINTLAAESTNSRMVGLSSEVCPLTTPSFKSRASYTPKLTVKTPLSFMEDSIRVGSAAELCTLATSISKCKYMDQSLEGQVSHINRWPALLAMASLVVGSANSPRPQQL